MIWTLAFWKGTAERALKTFGQTFVATVMTMVLGIDLPGIQDLNWVGVLSVAALATLLSVMTSIGNADFTAGEVQVAPANPPTVETQVNVNVPERALEETLS